MNYYIGIDPGLHGGLSVVDTIGKFVSTQDTPIVVIQRGKKTKNEYDIHEIKKFLQYFADIPDRVIVFIEKMQSMPPGFRVQASFSLGLSQGIYEGLLTALELPYRLVNSKEWQKYFQISSSKGDKKKQGFQIATKLFPDGVFTGPEGGVKDGRSDSILIAEWGRKHG